MLPTRQTRRPLGLESLRILGAPWSLRAKEVELATAEPLYNDESKAVVRPKIHDLHPSIHRIPCSQKSTALPPYELLTWQWHL